MDVIVDRFEGDFAVCERSDRQMVNIKKDKLPPHVKEGDVLTISGDKITLNSEKSRARDIQIKKLMDDLWLD